MIPSSNRQLFPFFKTVRRLDKMFWQISDSNDMNETKIPEDMFAEKELKETLFFHMSSKMKGLLYYYCILVSKTIWTTAWWSLLQYCNL